MTGLILILIANLKKPKMNIKKNKLEIVSPILVMVYQKVPNNSLNVNLKVQRMFKYFNF